MKSVATASPQGWVKLSPHFPISGTIIAPNIYEIIHEKIHFFARFYQKNKKYFLMRHKALIFRHFTDRRFSSNSPMRRAARFSMRHPIHIADCFLPDLRSYARTLMCNYTLKTDFCRRRGHNLRAPRRILPESAGKYSPCPPVRGDTACFAR